MLRFACPQCVTWLKAPETAAGTRRRCPCCQFVFEVPRKSQTAPAGEGYSLRQSRGASSASEVEYIPVVCSLCRTRMYGTIDLVGQELVCPDCGTSAVVPPLGGAVQSTKAPLPASEIGEYQLAEEVERPTGSVSAAEQVYVPVICRRCQTRLHATLDQVGSSLVCPDCGTANDVAPPPPRRKPLPTTSPDDVYGLAGSVETNPPVPASPSASVEELHAPKERPPRRRPSSNRPVLPRWPFLTGTFSFPFSRGTWTHVLALSVWSLLCLGILAVSGQLNARGDAAGFYGAIMLGAVALMLTVMWLMFASTCGLVVVRQTANGCNEIEDWPGWGFTEWLFEPLYLLTGLCLGLLPGVVLNWGLGELGYSCEAAAPIGLFFFFPIVLLSALERDSPLSAVSMPVVRSLWTAWSSWLAFYATTAILLAAAGNLVLAVRSVGVLWEVVAANVLLPVVWFIYFRLLGRLAWCCADQARQAEREMETEAGETPLAELHGVNHHNKV